MDQQFAVENRPGAASNVATEMVARAQPDGYPVMELATVNGINASLYKNLNYDLSATLRLSPAYEDLGDRGFGRQTALVSRGALVRPTMMILIGDRSWINLSGETCRRN